MQFIFVPAYKASLVIREQTISLEIIENLIISETDSTTWFAKRWENTNWASSPYCLCKCQADKNHWLSL